MQTIQINKKILIFSIQDRDLFTTLSSTFSLSMCFLSHSYRQGLFPRIILIAFRAFQECVPRGVKFHFNLTEPCKDTSTIPLLDLSYLT